MFPLQKFKDYIAQNNLMQPEHKVLLTVSGGKDSVLLVHLFKRAGYHFGIAHCNFNLRAEEAQRDEAFVRMLASLMEVPFHVTHFQTKAYAALHKISTQMAARTLRYDWFEETRQSGNYDLIAVAHHQSDAIETILLNLTRGTGIAGLHGILPKRDKLIRPLLFLSRPEIEEIIAQEHLDFVEDSSNNSDKYARNKIRLHVVPQLKAINPNLAQTFEHNIQRFTETEMVLQQAVEKLRSTVCITQQDVTYLSLASIKALLPQKLLLYELLKPFNFQEPVVGDILQSLDKQTGISFYSRSHRATINRAQLMVTSIVIPSSAADLSIHPNDTSVNFGTQQLEITHSESLEFEKGSHKAFMDSEKLVYPLILRNKQPGDRFMPLGMTTFKKLSDFLIDEKVPLPVKDQIPVLVNGNGEILWIAGWRADNRYKVTPATKKVTIFELKNK